MLHKVFVIIFVSILYHRLLMISIDLSETTDFEHWRGRKSNPVATLPHAAVTFRMQPFNSLRSTGTPIDVTMRSDT